MDAYLGYVEVVDLDKNSSTMGNNLLKLHILSCEPCEMLKGFPSSLIL